MQEIYRIILPPSLHHKTEAPLKKEMSGPMGPKYICLCLVHTYTKISLVLRFCVVSYCELVALFKNQLLKKSQIWKHEPLSVCSEAEAVPLGRASRHRFLLPSRWSASFWRYCGFTHSESLCILNLGPYPGHLKR